MLSSTGTQSFSEQNGKLRRRVFTATRITVWTMKVWTLYPPAVCLGQFAQRNMNDSKKIFVGLYLRLLLFFPQQNTLETGKLMVYAVYCIDQQGVYWPRLNFRMSSVQNIDNTSRKRFRSTNADVGDIMDSARAIIQKKNWIGHHRRSPVPGDVWLQPHCSSWIMEHD